MPRIHHHRFTVTPASIDINGHVNNLEYLRWMQDVATEHTARQGWSMRRYVDSGSSWVARRHEIEYLRPAFEGDELVVLTWVENMDARSSLRRYLFWQAQSKKIIATAETLWYFVDVASGRAVAITDEVRDSFELVPADDQLIAALRRGGPKSAEAVQAVEALA